MCLRGLSVQSLHGDREQYDREEALKDFKESMLQEGICVLFLSSKVCRSNEILFQVMFGSLSPQIWLLEGWTSTI